MQKPKFKTTDSFPKSVTNNNVAKELIVTVGYKIEHVKDNQWELNGIPLESKLTDNGKRMVFEWSHPVNIYLGHKFFIIFGDWRNNLLQSLQERISTFIERCLKQRRKDDYFNHWKGIAKKIEAIIPESKTSFVNGDCIIIEFQNHEYKLDVFFKKKPTFGFKTPQHVISNSTDRYRFQCEFDDICRSAELLCDLMRVNNILNIKFK